ncbi:hypothetical protein PMIN03_007024 [Paraphaeosphaeria minitans]
MSTRDSEGSPGAVDTNSYAEQKASSPPKSAPDIACNNCRKAKLRCSRDRPSCAHCRKTGADCLYETKRTKPGLKTGAIENVHRRLDALERQTKEQAELCRGSHPSASVDSQDMTAREILSLLARELPKLDDGTIESQSRLWSPKEAMPGAKRKRVFDDEDEVCTVDGSNSLSLNPALLEEAIAAYFFYVHPWIPMIHEGRFRRRLEHGGGRARLIVVIEAMVVAASRFVPNASISAGTIAQMRSRVITAAMDSVCLESLQALIIVAYTDIGDGNAAKAWSLVGSLTRTVGYSQLAQEREDNEHRSICQPFEILDHTADWTELEERRRIFWNVFNLDRFCSVAMGWNTSLTSADVYRRLPCDGHLWRKEEAAATPYFGIWDKSAGRMGVPMGFLVEADDPPEKANKISSADGCAPQDLRAADMSNVGAVAYQIEATESMSRVVICFLQQKVNMRSQQEVSSWLTRFKELDLRLVHWKMLLPQKWKSNPNMTRPVLLMDPNLTLAHVTHNASMILLHQLIAYPPFHWPFRSRLPSSCSVEACYSAAMEIATISQRYLANSPEGRPAASQFAFCIFIAGRVLLIHWRFNPGNKLPNEFWSLVQCLEEMSSRSTGLSTIPTHDLNLAGRYAARLKELYLSSVRNESFRISVADYTNEITYRVNTSSDTIQPRRPIHAREMHPRPNIPVPGVGIAEWPVEQTDPHPDVPLFKGTQTNISDAGNLEGMDYDTLPQLMQDQHFTDMDRIIAFDDGSMFAATIDGGMF